jgi:hypothetical protein
LIGITEVCRNDEVWMRIGCGNRRKIYRRVGMGLVDSYAIRTKAISDADQRRRS